MVRRSHVLLVNSVTNVKGPEYCDDGCQSNCDATAECGVFADEPGKECPLKVCCSQYGFCGTTELFCDDKCQSNCGRPDVPEGGSSVPVRQNKVIGYYESWYALSYSQQDVLLIIHVIN
jgi:chitinase